MGKIVMSAVKNAWRGIAFTFKNERHFRIEIIASILVITGLTLLQGSSFDFMIILIVIMIVLMAETINTAIERIINIIHPNHHQQAGIVKDVSAGFVLISIFGSIIIGIIIFYPLVYQLF
jgi:diacylglycerol kinase